MMIIRPHNLGHELNMLIKIGSRLLHHSISFYFYVEFCSYFFNRPFFFFFALDLFFRLLLFFQFYHSTFNWLKIGFYNFFNVVITIL
jgi:hypothetical protein